MIWKLGSIFFSRGRDADSVAGSGPLNGVLTHENGIHLYKSPDAAHVVMRQMTDYAAVGFAFGWITGMSNLAIMPLFLLTIQMPRKLSTMRHFTWHAELLPHTEQVVFKKATLFGAIDSHYVDIRDLEKIDSSEVSAFLMWEINMFDPDMCFRDASTGEVFVFDKQGQWN